MKQKRGKAIDQDHEYCINSDRLHRIERTIDKFQERILAFLSVYVLLVGAMVAKVAGMI